MLPFVYLLYKLEKYSYQEYSYFTKPIAICYNKSLCDIVSSMDIKLDNFEGYICLEVEYFENGHLSTDHVDNKKEEVVFFQRFFK